MRTSFDSYSDPGHGWVRVPFRTLQDLGLIERISPYSYMRGAYAYLEEDCDASLLVDTMRKVGLTPKFRHRIGDKTSKIRGYESYHAPTFLSRNQG